jgi:hypothetical protein
MSWSTYRSQILRNFQASYSKIGRILMLKSTITSLSRICYLVIKKLQQKCYPNIKASHSFSKAKKLNNRWI